LRPDERLAVGVRERVDGAGETEFGKRLGLSLPWPEAGTPEQPLGLSDVERSCECGYP